MSFISALEVALALIGWILLFTQLVFPLWLHRPVFRMLRRRAKLETQLREVQEKGDEVKIESQIEAAQRKAERLIQARRRERGE